VALGLQLILWHDAASGRAMRWAHGMNEGGAVVDIGAQMKATLATAHEDNGHD
jgi:ABC-type sulfate transport system permease component